jgi:cyclopropane fatty-acyl-phospholipid synthase-like methyltransferase
MEQPMDAYLTANYEYWQKGYEAANVESFVFRWHGRILQQRLGVSSGTLLDWGCGSGAALQFFQRKGFEVYGVDISKPDIARAAERVGAERVRVIDPEPNAEPFFQTKFDVVISVQSLYLLAPDRLAVLLEALHSQMSKGGIIYATMIGKQSHFYDKSVSAEQGMRRVRYNSDRLGAVDEYFYFMESREQLVSTFRFFEPLLVGYYDFDWGEGSEFHYTFTGKRQ